MSIFAQRRGLFLVVLICAACNLFVGCGVTRKAMLPVSSERAFMRYESRLNDNQIDSLKAIYGNNKLFIEEYIEPTLIALSYFPELKDTHIEFCLSDGIKTTMAARPKVGSLFWRTKYLIQIADESEGSKEVQIPLSTVPFNAKIGIIGHELAHIADYQNKNLWGVTGTLFRYGSRAHKPLFEREIDRATIERGLGWQLYDWAQFSLYDNTTADEEYREFKRKTYMQPEEIKQLIYFFSRYSQSL